MNERDQILFLHRKSEILFSLRDDFNDTRAAGAVNGTPPTPGPGGVRDVVDIGSGVPVGSGVLSMSGDNSWTTTLLAYTGITRITGRVFIANITHPDTTKLFLIGFNQINSGATNSNMLYFRSDGLIYFYDSGGGAVAPLASYQASVSYKVACVIRSSGCYYFIKGGLFTNWTKLYGTSTQTYATLYPMVNRFSTGTAIPIDFIRVPLQKWLPTPIVYDTFTRDNGAIGSTEAIGPDGQQAPVKAWTGATWAVVSNKAVNTPTEGGELVVNGNFSAWAGDDPTGWTVTGEITTDPEVSEVGTGQGHGGAGTGLANMYRTASVITLTQTILSIGLWYQMELDINTVVAGNIKFGDSADGINSGILSGTGSFFTTGRAGNTSLRIRANTNPTDITIDNSSAKLLTLSTLFSSLEASKTDVIVTAIPSAFVAGTQMGVVTHMDDAANPANFLLSYIDGTDIHFVKCVGGVYTPLISTAQAYVSGKLPLIIAWRDGSDLMARLYYDDVFIGTEQTISNAGIIDNTLIGQFSTHDGNIFDSFLSFPRGQNDTSYAALNGFIT